MHFIVTSSYNTTRSSFVIAKFIGLQGNSLKRRRGCWQWSLIPMIRRNFHSLDGLLTESPKNRSMRRQGEPWLSQNPILEVLKCFCVLREGSAICNHHNLVVHCFVSFSFIPLEQRNLFDLDSGDMPWLGMLHVPLEWRVIWRVKLELGMCALSYMNLSCFL